MWNRTALSIIFFHQMLNPTKQLDHPSPCKKKSTKLYCTSLKKHCSLPDEQLKSGPLVAAAIWELENILQGQVGILRANKAQAITVMKKGVEKESKLTESKIKNFYLKHAKLTKSRQVLLWYGSFLRLWS